MNVRRNPVRIGPVLLIVGAAAGLISGATHGDLPEDSGAAALRFVADHPAYALVHLTAILGAVLWTLGLSGWRPDTSTPSGQWLAAAAGRTALIGTAVLAVQFTIDGIGLPALAALSSRPDAQPEMFETIAEVAPEALIGTALIWVILLYGLTPILAGASRPTRSATSGFHLWTVDPVSGPRRIRALAIAPADEPRLRPRRDLDRGWAVLTWSMWPRTRLTTIALAGVTLAGVGGVLVGLAPADVAPYPHGVAAILQLPGVVAPLLLGLAVRRTDRLIAWPSIGAGLVGIVGTVLFALRLPANWFGLLERVALEPAGKGWT